MDQAVTQRGLPNLFGEYDLASHDPDSEQNVQQAQQAYDRRDYKNALCCAQQAYLKAWNDAFAALRIWTDCLTATHAYAKAQAIADQLKAAAPERPDGVLCEAKNYVAQYKLLDATNACAAGLRQFHSTPLHVMAFEQVQQTIRGHQLDCIPRLPTELIHLIFQHFEQHFLVLTCMAVSKAWHAKLVQCAPLWHTFLIEPQRHRFAHAMGSLRILSDIGPHVHAIQVARATRLWPERLLRLARTRCLDNLVSLSISGFDLDSHILGEALWQLHNITTLKIGLIQSPQLTLGILFANLPRLVLLHYDKLDSSNGQLDSPLPRADNLRALRINLRGVLRVDNKGIRHLLMACPNLECFSVSASAEEEDCLPIVDELGTHLWLFELGHFDLSSFPLEERSISNRRRQRSIASATAGLVNIKIETAETQTSSLDQLLSHHCQTIEEIRLIFNHNHVSTPLRSGGYRLERVQRVIIDEPRNFRLGVHLAFIQSLLAKCTALQSLHLSHAHNERVLYQRLHELPIRELVLTSTSGYAPPNLVYFAQRAAEQGDLCSLRSLTLNKYYLWDPMVQDEIAGLKTLEELALLDFELPSRDCIEFFHRLENHPRLRVIVIGERYFFNDTVLEAIGKIKALQVLAIHCSTTGWSSLNSTRTKGFKERRRIAFCKYPQIQTIHIKNGSS